MRYWLDTEFIDDGKTIDLISIGIVAEDGRELYMQSTQFDIGQANQWVRENVIMHLEICPHITQPPGLFYSLGTIYGAQAQHHKGQCRFFDDEKRIAGAYADCPWRTREQIRDELLHFMNTGSTDLPEFWGWCSAYDYVALCQLFGTMMHLPQGWPHYIKDFQYLLDERGIISDVALPPQEEGLHNALADARHLKRLWGYILRNDAWQ